VAQNPFLIEEEPTAPVTPVVTQPETVNTNPFLVQEEQPVAQANPFLIPEEPVVPEALTTDFGDVTSERTYPIAEAEVEADVGVNPFAALEVVDRPRAAVASGLIATLEGKDAETIKAEAAKGISGEQHPMMGEYFSKKAKEVVDNPTEYPTLNTVFKGVDSLFSEAVKKYQVGMMPINIAKSGVYADLIKIGMADTEQEKQEAREDLNASLKSAFEPLVDAYTSNTAGLDALAYTAGFGVDVAIDPVTYTNPILSFTKKGKILIPDAILDQYAKAANTTKQKAKDVLTKTKTGQSLTDAANYAWNLFSTKNQFKNKPKVEELRENFLNLIASGRVQAIREGREFQDRIKVFARETNTTEKEVEMFITEAVERGGVNNVNLAELSDEAIELLSKDDNIRYEVWSLSQRNADQLAKEIDAGVTITPLSEQPLLRVGDEDDALLLAYFNRAVTPDARKAINEKREAKGYKPIAEGGEGPTNMSGKHSSTIARNEEWEGLTINDINDMAKRGELPGYEGKVFKDGFFYSDPAIAQALRDSKHYRAIASRDLADQIIDPANNISIAPEKLIQAAQKSGWQPKTKNPTVVGALRYLKKNRKGWDRWEISNNPMTEGYVMDREIVEFVDGNLNKIYDPQEINKFLNTADQVTNWWKAWTLSIFPSYHFRNEVGNVWNNFVMDVDPKFYQEAAKIQEAVMGSQITPPRWGKTGRTPTVSEGPLPAYTKFKTKDGTEYTYTQLRDMMDEQGIIGKGFMATDIESTLRSEMGDAKWLTLSKENKAIEIGKRIGEGLENNARMANFLDGLNKGLSPEQAAARVRKTLFDYSDLTQFEQDVMKRIMPFYTWTRKNVPFQIEQMIKKPGRYKAVDTLRQELESAISEEDTNERYLASWMIENYPTKVKIDEETGDPRYFILGGWLPAADAWKLAAAPARVFKDNLHPGIKLIYERISADEDGYVTDLFTGQKLHPKLKQNFVGVEMPETVAHDLKNLRLLATMDDFIQSVRNSESDQKIIKVLQGDHILGKAEKKLSPFASKPKTVEESLIAFLTGFRTYAVNLDQQKMFAGMDEEQKIKQLQKLYEQSAKRGSAQPELIEQAIDVTKEAQKKFKLGGMLDQARKLFNKGGVADKKGPDYYNIPVTKEDIDLYEKAIEENSDKNFIQRMKDVNSPSLRATDKEGYEYEETHRMGAGQLSDGSWAAYPTIIQTQAGELIKQEDIRDASGRIVRDKAKEYAEKTGQYVNFGDDKYNAIRFSIHYKHTPSWIHGRGKPGYDSRARVTPFAKGGMAAADDPEGVSTEGVDMPEERPLSETIYRAGKTYEHMARGATAAMLGGAGDIEALGRGVYEGATGEDSFGEGFQRGIQKETVLPTTEDVKEYLPEVTGDEFMTDKQREVASGMGEFTGLSLPIGAAAKGTAALARASSKKYKDYVDEIYNNPGQLDYAKNTDRELENAFERDQFKREMEEYDAQFVDPKNPSDRPQREKIWQSTADNPRTESEAKKILHYIQNGTADINDAAEFAFNQQKKAATQRAFRTLKKDRDRVRGYRAYASRVNDFVDKGYISDESADIALWFVDKNRKLVDDISITAVSDLEKGTSGVYSISERLVKLSKGDQIPELVMHETLHHTERMLPSDIRDGIRKSWEDAVKKEIKLSKKAGQQSRAEALADVMMLPYVKGPDLDALTKRMKQYAKDGVLKSGDYQYTNPSEFWAVNGSDILRNQYKVQGKWVGKAVEYYKQLAEKLKDMFGLASTNALYKGLKNLETSDGTFVRKEGLREVQDISNFIERNSVYGWSLEGLNTRLQMSDILDMAKEGEKDFLDTLPSKTLPIAGNEGKAAYDVLGKSLDDKKAWRETNKVNQKQKQTPELKEQAEKLFAGEITGDEFRSTAAALRPPTKFTEVTKMPTFEEIVFSLDENKVSTGIIGLNKSIPDGTEVASRLDIPAYEGFDTWVVSLHESGGRTTKGKSLGYGKTSVLNNVEFGTQPQAAINIAKGKSKTTIGRIYGQWENHDSDELFNVAQKLIDDPEWTQVGMNPYRASYFYDKDTLEPVVAAEQVIQVGPLVLAKGVQRTSPNDPRFRFDKKGNNTETFADGGLAEGNLNEEIAPEYDTMDAAPVEQPVQQVQEVRQAQAPQKPVAQVPNEEEAYLDRLAEIESSNNTNAYAETSGALGLYQFVPKTWDSMVTRYMPELKQQKGDYMEFRRNPEVSRYMARKLMEENKNILKKKGVNATRSNLYLAHFAGPSGAVAVARAKPNTPISEVLSEGQIKRNPGVFNKVKTAGQLMQWAQMKMLGAKK